MIKKIFWYFTMVCGLLITLFSIIIALGGIITTLTSGDKNDFVAIILSFFVLVCFVFLGSYIFKIGRRNLATLNNTNENIYKAVEMPLIKRLFWILTIAVGFLMVFSIVCFTLISLYILITYEQARYIINIANGFVFTFVFLSSTFLGFYLMRTGRRNLTVHEENTEKMVEQNFKNKLVTKIPTRVSDYLARVSLLIMGVIIIYVGLSPLLLVAGVSSVFNDSSWISFIWAFIWPLKVENLLFFLLTLTFVSFGILNIFRSIFWKKVDKDEIPKLEVKKLPNQ